jgi:DASH complex subunit SPC19
MLICGANRLKALRQKKERLGYAVERLQLQSQQRQRQLRMSVAAT